MREAQRATDAPIPTVDATPSAARSYLGPERRRRRVFITQTTEYHFVDTRCVLVRDRRTGEILRSHLALWQDLEGVLGAHGYDGPLDEGRPVQPGDALRLRNGTRELITSPILRIERPTQSSLLSYPEEFPGDPSDSHTCISQRHPSGLR